MGYFSKFKLLQKFVWYLLEKERLVVRFKYSKHQASRIYCVRTYSMCLSRGSNLQVSLTRYFFPGPYMNGHGRQLPAQNQRITPFFRCDW